MEADRGHCKCGTLQLSGSTLGASALNLQFGGRVLRGCRVGTGSLPVVGAWGPLHGDVHWTGTICPPKMSPFRASRAA
eukprot:scaffold2995_cov430-Prasinococcus_capsulatus_cf.AAC.6